jgi:outer membrane protein, heavy metal efflux system
VLAEATKAFIDVLVAQDRMALTEETMRLSEQVLNAAEELSKRLAQNPDLARWAIEMASRQKALRGFLVKLSLPLVLFDRNQRGVLETRYRLARDEEERRVTEMRLASALAEAYQALLSAYRDVTVIQQEVLPAAQEAFDAAAEGYDQGKFGFLDVLDAQRTVFETRGQYLEAL